MLNLLEFRLFICIYVHLLAFQNNPTDEECMLQKKTVSFGLEVAELHRNLHFYRNRLLSIQHVQTV
jgi:hypothetical protein